MKGLISMSIFNFKLRKHKEPLQIIQEVKKPNIEIRIESENDTPVFENEDIAIKEGAQILLDNKNVDSLEEGIITFATMFRGLKYKETETSEDGKTTIVLRETAYQKTL